MRKSIIARSAILALLAGFVVVSSAPSQADTLRVPKTSFLPCAVQNGLYCVDSVIVTTSTGQKVPLTWVPSGQAVPAAPTGGGISFAPMAEVANNVVVGNGWWTDQGMRATLTDGTAKFLDISNLIDTPNYPQQGAIYDSTNAETPFDVTQPVDWFGNMTQCNNTSNGGDNGQAPWDQCYKGAVAVIDQGQVQFIWNYNTQQQAAANVKQYTKETFIDLKDLASKGQQPKWGSKYDPKTKTFATLEPLQTPVWVTNNSLINGWDVAGSSAVLPPATTTPIDTSTVAPVTQAAASAACPVSGSATPSATPSASPSPSPSASAASSADALTPQPAAAVAPLDPNACTTLQPPAAMGRAFSGRWTSPLWNQLGLNNLGYDGLYVDAKAANEFVNDLFIDVNPTLTNQNNAVGEAVQPGNTSYAVNLDPNVTIAVGVRVDNLQTGITVAVGVDTTVSSQQQNGYQLVTVEGSPVTVPLAKNAATDCTGEAGVAKANVRQFQTLIIPQNDTNGFGVDGTTGRMYVGSNGVCSLTSPTWDPSTKTFSWTAAAPHFAPDGTTVNLGFYKAVIPYQDAAALWGLTNPADAATALTVSVSTEAGGSSAAISKVSAKNGNIIIDVSGFSYSRPKLSIKIKPGYKPSSRKVTSLPLPKLTATCVMGQTVKKITATNPVCPKGYKHVGPNL